MKIYTHDKIPLGEVPEGQMEQFTSEINATLSDRRIWVAQAMNYVTVLVNLVGRFMLLVPSFWFWMLICVVLTTNAGDPTLGFSMDSTFTQVQSLALISLQFACIGAFMLLATQINHFGLQRYGLRKIREEVLSDQIRTFLANKDGGL